MKFVSKGPTNNILALIQIMAWCCPGDKPLSEPTIAQFTDAYVSLGLNDLTIWPMGIVAVSLIE